MLSELYTAVANLEVYVNQGTQSSNKMKYSNRTAITRSTFKSSDLHNLRY